MYYAVSDKIGKHLRTFLSTKAKKMQGAYLTIELSLIFPIILLVIVLVVHWSFMMYDRVIMSQDAYLLALRGAVISDDEPVDLPDD